MPSNGKKMSRKAKPVTRSRKGGSNSAKSGALVLTAREERNRLGTGVNPFSTIPQAVEVKVYRQNLGNIQLYHNVPRSVTSGGTADLLSGISQGVAYNQRVGDRVYLKRYHARILLNNKSDRPNVSYRFALVAVVNSTTTDDLTELYCTPSANYFTGFIESNQAMVIYDKVIAQPDGPIFPTASTFQKERSTYVELDIPINQTAVWASSVGGTNQRVLVYPIMTVFDAAGSLVTDNIASFSADVQLTFTDM